MPTFYPYRSPNMDARLRHIENHLCENSTVNPSEFPGGIDPTGRGKAGTVQAFGTIREAQVVFDPTGGHAHDGSSSHEIALAGDVAGTNLAATVTLAGDVTGRAGVTVVGKLQGKTVPAAPAATDTAKALRYDGANYSLQTARWRTGNVTTTATLGANDEFMTADAIGGAFTITLPAAATSAGVVYRILKKDVSANAVTIKGSGTELINGANTTALAAQYSHVTVICDGVQWWII